MTSEGRSGGDCTDTGSTTASSASITGKLRQPQVGAVAGIATWTDSRVHELILLRVNVRGHHGDLLHTI